MENHQPLNPKSGSARALASEIKSCQTGGKCGVKFSCRGQQKSEAGRATVVAINGAKQRKRAQHFCGALTFGIVQEAVERIGVHLPKGFTNECEVRWLGSVKLRLKLRPEKFCSRNWRWRTAVPVVSLRTICGRNNHQRWRFVFQLGACSVAGMDWGRVKNRLGENRRWRTSVACKVDRWICAQGGALSQAMALWDFADSNRTSVEQGGGSAQAKIASSQQFRKIRWTPVIQDLRLDAQLPAHSGSCAGGEG